MPVCGCSPVPLLDTVGWCRWVTGCARSFRRHPFWLRPTGWWEGSPIGTRRLCMGLHLSFTTWNTPHWFTLYAHHNTLSVKFQCYCHNSLLVEIEDSTPLLQKPTTGGETKPMLFNSHSQNHLLKIHINVILWSASWPSKWLLSKRVLTRPP